MVGGRGVEDKVVKLSNNKKQHNLLILVYRDLRKGIRGKGNKNEIVRTLFKIRRSVHSMFFFTYMFLTFLSIIPDSTATNLPIFFSPTDVIR